MLFHTECTYTADMWYNILGIWLCGMSDYRKFLFKGRKRSIVPEWKLLRRNTCTMLMTLCAHIHTYFVYYIIVIALGNAFGRGTCRVTSIVNINYIHEIHWHYSSRPWSSTAAVCSTLRNKPTPNATNKHDKTWITWFLRVLWLVQTHASRFQTI
jgi:hypothetical protein